MSSGTGLPLEEALARAVEGAVRNALNNTPSSRTNSSTNTNASTSGTSTATTIMATSSTATPSTSNIINQVRICTVVYINISNLRIVLQHNMNNMYLFCIKAVDNSTRERNGANRALNQTMLHLYCRRDCFCDKNTKERWWVVKTVISFAYHHSVMTR